MRIYLRHLSQEKAHRYATDYQRPSGDTNANHEVKVFKSISWEGKLEAFAAAFDGHKEALQKDLSMHASLGIERANKTLASVEVSVQSTGSNLNMLLLFEQLRSPEERELRKFIESKGGADKFLKDSELMDELVDLSRRGEGTDGSQVNSHMIKADLKKDLGDLINEGIAVSDNKFCALQVNIRAQMETSMRREGDRIIGTILSGPHDRIIDPVSTALPRTVVGLTPSRTYGRFGQKWDGRVVRRLVI